MKREKTLLTVLTPAGNEREREREREREIDEERLTLMGGTVPANTPKVT